MAEKRKRTPSADDHPDLTGEERLLRAVIVDSLPACREYRSDGAIRNVLPHKVRAEYKAGLGFPRQVNKNVPISPGFKSRDLIADVTERVIAGDEGRQPQ
jgi:hypothetical protein